MKSIKSLFTIFSLFALLTGSLPNFAVADTDPCSSDIAGQSKAQLQADLNACTAEIAHWTDILNNTKQQSASYARDVAALTAQINQAQANIKAKNIAIANLSSDIAAKQQTINNLNGQLDQGDQSLAEIIRKTNELDSFSLPEAVLSNQALSDFFVDVDTYAATERSMEDLFNQIRGTKALTQAQQIDLEKQKQAQADARAAIEAAKQQVQVAQAQKKILLAQSQSQEATYSQVLAQRQAAADKIRAALFNLADTSAIPFGTALKYAEEASAETGVRPAFLLAILTQESNLGANVGTCYVTNTVTGDGVGASTGNPKSRVMNPTRDIPVFQNILSALGMSMTNTRVSCWQPIYSSSGAPLGWGGAMGAAQFIPSTWKLFMPRISSMDGSSYPNPWNARDAFYAAAIYLSDLGAGAGTRSAEKAAACRYYSGSGCNTWYANSYGNSVLSKASNIQTTMIDPLQGL